jgi:aldehyde dehydrogenase (NAD+)
MQTSPLCNQFNTTPVADIAPKLQQLNKCFASGKTKALLWRIEQLKQIRKMVIEQQDEIFVAMQQDLGRCNMESWTAELG